MPVERYDFIFTQRGLEKVENSMTRVERATEATRRSLALMRSALVAIAGLQIAEQFAEMSDTFLLANARLRLITVTTREATQVMSQLQSVMAETGSSMEATVNLFNRMTRATQGMNLSSENLVDITRGIQQAMIIGGASTQEMTSGIIQLGQALGKGNLDGDELRSITENFSVLTDIIAREFGVAGRELRAFSEANPGILTTERILAGISRELPALNEQFGNIERTVGQAFQNLANQFRTFLGGSAQAVPVFRALTQVVDLLANNLVVLADAASAGLVMWLTYSALSSKLVTGIVAIATGQRTLAAATAGSTAAVMANEAAERARDAARQQALVRLRAQRVAEAQFEVERTRNNVLVLQATAATTGATARLSAARAELTKANAALTFSEINLQRAQTASAAASTAASVAAGRAAAANTVLGRSMLFLRSAGSGIVAFFGGPVIASLLALSAAIASVVFFANRARRASEEAMRPLAELDSRLAATERTIAEVDSYADPFQSIRESMVKTADVAYQVETGLSEGLGDILGAVGRAGLTEMERLDDELSDRLAQLREARDAAQSAYQAQQRRISRVERIGRRGVLDSERDQLNDLAIAYNNTQAAIDRVMRAKTRLLGISLSDMTDLDERREQAETSIADNLERQLGLARMNSVERQIQVRLDKELAPLRAESLEMSEAELAAARGRVEQAVRQVHAEEQLSRIREDMQRAADSRDARLEALNVEEDRRSALITMLERQNDARRRGVEISQEELQAEYESTLAFERRREHVEEMDSVLRELNGAMDDYIARTNAVADLRSRGLVTAQQELDLMREANLEYLQDQQGQGFLDSLILQLEIMSLTSETIFNNLGTQVAEIFGPGGSLQTGISRATADALLFGDSFEVGMRRVGQTIVTEVLSSLIRVGLQYGQNFLMKRLFDQKEIASEATKQAQALGIQGAAAASSVAIAAKSGAAIAKAMEPAALATSLATAGANSAGAILGISATKSALAAASTPGFADGVVDLNGPGTGTSDSILARLSAGESVVTADATRQFAPTLRAMNDGTYSGEGTTHQDNRQITFAPQITVQGGGDPEQNAEAIQEAMMEFAIDQQRPGGVFSNSFLGR